MASLRFNALLQCLRCFLNTSIAVFDEFAVAVFIIINGLKPSNPSVGQIYYISNFIDSETNKIYPFTGFFNGEKWIPISNNKEILSIEKRSSVIEGEGEGSIKKAVLDAKNEIIGDATTEFNNLGKIETKIIDTATIWEEY